MNPAVAAFLAAADAAAPVVTAPEVARRWAEPSALEGLTVGGLAGHLHRSVRRLEQVLDQPEPVGGRLESAAEYYGNAKVADRADFDGDLHRMIREDAERTATRGPERLAADFVATVERLRARLPRERPDRLVAVLLAEGGSRLDEYLATRVIELLVHSDDLAVSAGLPAPEAPADAAALAINTLVGVARGREGDLAVLRALAGRERLSDAGDVLRVL